MFRILFNLFEDLDAKTETKIIKITQLLLRNECHSLEGLCTQK